MINTPWEAVEECGNSITIRDADGKDVCEITSPTDVTTEREREIALRIITSVNMMEET